MTFTEYAEALERSPKASDRVVGRFVRTHLVRLEGWVNQALGGGRAKREDREELVQVAMLACAEAASAPDAAAALRSVGAALERAGWARKAWNANRIASLDHHPENEE